MKITVPVFLAIVAVVLGVTLLIAGLEDVFALLHFVIVVIAILLIVGGFTYLWKHSGCRALKPK
jgi:hypothetical protein